MKIKYKNISVEYTFINNNKEFNTIILPGWLQNKITYNKLFDTISKYTNIYILEFPGFNVSDEPLEIVSLEYYVELLNYFIENLNINNCILFGHSFGGRVAFKYQAIYKKATYLILTSPAGIKDFSLKKQFKILIYKIKKNLYKIFNKEKLKDLFNNSGSSDYRNLSYIMKKTFSNIVNEDLKKYIKQINIPTILFFGENDQTVKYKTGVKIKKIIKNSVLIKINNAGHFSFLENFYQYNLVLNQLYISIMEELL